MIDKIYLQNYTLENLRGIYKKISAVTKDFCPDSLANWCICKIVNAYNSNLDNIIEEIEKENKKNLPKIKLYFLGIDEVVGKYNKNEIESILKEWGLYIDEIGCEATIKKVLTDRYRKEVVVCNINNKMNSCYSKYLRLLLFIFRLYKVIDSEKKFKKYENGEDDIINYVKWKGFLQINRSVNNVIAYSLKNIDIKKVFSNDEELFNLIRDFYKYTFSNKRYFEYLKDIEKLKHIQKKRDEWIKFNKVKIISHEKLKLLEELNLVKIYITNDDEFVKLTDMSLSLLENRLVNKWEGEVLYLLDDMKEIIAINDNPIKITKSLVNKILIQEDTLFIFEE